MLRGSPSYYCLHSLWLPAQAIRTCGTLPRSWACSLCCIHKTQMCLEEAKWVLTELVTWPRWGILTWVIENGNVACIKIYLDDLQMELECRSGIVPSTMCSLWLREWLQKYFVCTSYQCSDVMLWLFLLQHISTSQLDNLHDHSYRRNGSQFLKEEPDTENWTRAAWIEDQHSSESAKEISPWLNHRECSFPFRTLHGHWFHGLNLSYPGQSMLFLGD